MKHTLRGAGLLNPTYRGRYPRHRKTFFGWLEVTERRRNAPALRDLSSAPGEIYEVSTDSGSACLRNNVVLLENGPGERS